MPTYEYECQNSGFRFEKFQNMSDEPLKRCPKCGGPVNRIIGTGGGIILRGAEYGSSSSRFARCSNETPCCGRAVPCDKPPCEDK